MTGSRMCSFALSTAFPIICCAPPVSAAARRDYQPPLRKNPGISRGRIYSTGGRFARHPGVRISTGATWEFLEPSMSRKAEIKASLRGIARALHNFMGTGSEERLPRN
jgi:hypothetical protein